MKLARKNENYFPTFFDRFWNNDLMDWNLTNFSESNSSLPAVNVKETKDEYFIEVAAPGMAKDDFKISLHNNVLTVSSEKKEETNEEKQNYTRQEFSYQSFQRSFTVPENNVESNKIAAAYSEGILKITLPKREEVKPKPLREIKIS